MKYIIVGMGSFGASLAEKLTEQGNEVIGIDSNMDRVENYKERITHTICMDATDEFTVSGLPLENTDLVIVAIGEDRGANVMATALFKNLKAKRLISRAIDGLHEKVLRAIGVEEIVHPEMESAERWAKKFTLHGVLHSFQLNEEHSIVQAKVPQRYVGRSIKDIDLRKKYSIIVMSIMKANGEDVHLKANVGIPDIKGVADPDHVLDPNDTLVLYGNNKDIKSFLRV